MKKGFESQRKNSTDEFLVEKKSPLVMPPDFDELPIPKEIEIKKDIIENIVWATRKGVEVQELALDILSEEEERLLQALILDDQ